MSAIAAVDMALWDIKAKLANMPLYQLLGGKSRNRIMTYTHANGETAQELVDEVALRIEQGYRAIRIQCGIPGISKTYGVTPQGVAYEPAMKGRPAEHSWNSSKYLNHVETAFARVREQFGDGIELLHDVHHRLTPIEAARLGKMLEPYHLFWLEDCVPAEDQQAFRLIRQHTTTPWLSVRCLTASMIVKSFLKNSSSTISEHHWFMVVASLTSGALPIWQLYIRFVPGFMVQPTSPRHHGVCPAF